MKFLMFLFVPTVLFAQTSLTFRDGGYWYDNMPLDATPKFTSLNIDSDTTNKILSIDDKMVKIERTYTVKDTIVFIKR